MARDTWLNWTLATIGIAGAGFAAGLHKLVWVLFLIAMLGWWALLWLGSDASDREDIFFWVMFIGAPMIVALVLRLVEGIALAVLRNITPADFSNEPPVRKKAESPSTPDPATWGK